MKKILFGFSLCIAALAVQAQTEVKTGLEAGVTSTGIKSIEYNGVAANINSTYNNRGGFYVGATAHINPSRGFSVQSGIRFASTEAGENIKILGTTLTARGTVSMNQVEIPLNFVFHPTKCKNKNYQKLSMYFGPQLAIAVSGKTNFKFNNGNVVDKKLEFGKGTTQYKRLQRYWAGGVAYQTSKSLAFTAAYHFGWNDIDNDVNFVTGFNSLRLGVRYTLK